MHSDDDVRTCIRVLADLISDPEAFARLSESERIELQRAAGLLSRPDRESLKKRNKAIRKEKRSLNIMSERAARASTGIRSAREAAVFMAPRMLSGPEIPRDVVELNSPRNCYICKAEFTKLHYFYDALCPECADFNYTKRFQTADLNGNTALITGARVKIGYQAALMMLRSGARVIALTRFPTDAALRYSKEEDFPQWRHRLQIFGLDLRHTPSVEIFARHIEETESRLDILINNAAQTVRRPPQFYAHLLENERHGHSILAAAQLDDLLAGHADCVRRLGSEPDSANLPVRWQSRAPGIGLSKSAELSQIAYEHDQSLEFETVFPEGKLDADLQQVDLRNVNSWRLKLGDVKTSEMIEIQLVNAVAPFVLCNRLANLMKRDFTGCKHIVNVSAMEGKFLRFKNNGRHPHTNMAKAALNMLTHTSAQDLANFGIFMNAVDTGWVTDEDPVLLAQRKQQLHDFQPPLDIVDGAARVCDPFFDGIKSGVHWFGKFLKDYKPIDW
jgi:NAD(P)-dependent dehydrogenase (short-subunit alcohol dehydrogenase family)